MKDTFEKPADIFEWLSQFINLEQGYAPPSMRPERMQIICEAAGNPEKCAPSIHIAGSKGKGSVTAMITRILQEAGLKTARYMSPHITEYRERITLGDEFFADSIYLNAGEKLKAISAVLTNPASCEYKALRDVSDGNPEPTFFELLTLFYFLCAKEAKVDVLVIETGMGGRLDPTNVVPSEVAVITIIELEHTEFLGTNIESVAGEKAGIIKKDKTVILGEQRFNNALAVFKETARQKNAPLFYSPQTAQIENLHITQAGTEFKIVFTQKDFFDMPLNIQLGIPGEVQAKNAVLAVLAVKKAFPKISAECIQNALKNFSLIARFEKLAVNPPVIVDGAHTDISVHLCVQTFTGLYGSNGILLFGCAAGKNDAAMAEAALPYFSRVYITTPGTFKISEPEKVYETFLSKQKNIPQCNTDIVFIKETQTAIARALDDAAKDGKPVLGIGSFYLAAEIRDFVQNKIKQP